MTQKKSDQPTAQATVHSFIGNIGCIRFPVPIRKASGIKRGDRLSVRVIGSGGIILEKLDPLDRIHKEEASEVRVEACACASPPEACSNSENDVVTVGWSYVQLTEEQSFDLGFLPDSPIKLVAEPSQIMVFRHLNLKDLEGIPPVTCPP